LDQDQDAAWAGMLNIPYTTLAAPHLCSPSQQGTVKAAKAPCGPSGAGTSPGRRSGAHLELACLLAGNTAAWALIVRPRFWPSFQSVPARAHVVIGSHHSISPWACPSCPLLPHSYIRYAAVDAFLSRECYQQLRILTSGQDPPARCAFCCQALAQPSTHGCIPCPVPDCL